MRACDGISLALFTFARRQLCCKRRAALFVQTVGPEMPAEADEIMSLPNGGSSPDGRRTRLLVNPTVSDSFDCVCCEDVSFNTISLA